jgi:hypothetical protein
LNRTWIRLSVLALLGCAPTPAPSDSIVVGGAGEQAPRPGESATRGVIRVVGSAPVNVQVVLQPSDGGSIRLVGALREELMWLAGMAVAGAGARRPSPDPLASGEIEVTSYRIVAVDGEPVVMGEIVAAGTGRATLRTAAGEEVTLDPAPSSLRVGQKVWVQGPRHIAVQGFGVIREGDPNWGKWRGL